MAIPSNKLNDNQIQLLQLLFKFRYVTGKLVAEYKRISNTAAYYSLKILFDQKLVDRRYDNQCKIQGRPAAYYLTTEALRLLRNRYKLNAMVLDNLRKNNRLGDGFIDDNLTIMTVYLRLQDTYPDVFNTFTATELGDFGYFPHPKPNLYLSRKKPADGLPSEFMLDIFADNRKFIIKKRIDVYIEHYATGDWGEGQYPTILLICPDPRSEEYAQKYVKSLLEDFDFLTTTKNAFLDKPSKEVAIWTDVFNPKKMINLA